LYFGELAAQLRSFGFGAVGSFALSLDLS